MLLQTETQQPPAPVSTQQTQVQAPVPRTQQPYMMSVQNLQNLQGLGDYTQEQLHTMLQHMQQQQTQQARQQQQHPL
ncbi:hypothetical protein B0H16DRAFT_1708903 [Mycena metata]|uniref:Uncharacterized protein n=1 Tax=Mycena metata TaxID=1033252 RepID=A0AAD7KEP3_9AGAR|nr:hypothetical protein B0H16DRAFT_1708903 [Mycena metata]